MGTWNDTGSAKSSPVTSAYYPPPVGRLRDWSNIKGRGGGASKLEGGACEVLPLRKGGVAEKVEAMLKRGHKTFGVVFMW